MSWKEEKQLPVPAECLLPHRGDMLLVDRLLERNGETAVGSAFVPKDGLFIDEERLYQEFFIEVVAQTAGAASSYDEEHGAPKEGMLVGIDDFTLFHQPEPGATLTVQTERLHSFGPVSVIEGEVFSGRRRLARAVIKVWEQM